MQILRRTEAEQAYSIPEHIYTRTELQPGETDPHQIADMSLAKKVYNVLFQHYPGQPWGVLASHKHGIVQIRLPCFTNWCHVVKIATLKSDPGMRSVVIGAGEFLERYNIPRSGFKTVEFVRAMKQFAPKHSRGKPPD